MNQNVPGVRCEGSGDCNLIPDTPHHALTLRLARNLSEHHLKRDPTFTRRKTYPAPPRARLPLEIPGAEFSRTGTYGVATPVMNYE